MQSVKASRRVWNDLDWSSGASGPAHRAGPRTAAAAVALGSDLLLASLRDDTKKMVFTWTPAWVPFPMTEITFIHSIIWPLDVTKCYSLHLLDGWISHVIVALNWALFDFRCCNFAPTKQEHAHHHSQDYHCHDNSDTRDQLTRLKASCCGQKSEKSQANPSFWYRSYVWPLTLGEIKLPLHF